MTITLTPEQSMHFEQGAGRNRSSSKPSVKIWSGSTSARP